MARTRNHQLKVWNRFDGGVQNVPADHLIQENAFTFATNLNNTDGTIRPIKGDKVLPTQLNADTYQVLKENVRGSDSLIQTTKPITFVNYADTVYYVENDGSTFKQINPITKAPTEALLVISEDDISVNEVSDLDIEIAVNEALDVVRQAKVSFTDAVQPYLDQWVDADGTVPLLTRIENKLQYFNYAVNDITLDNYKDTIVTANEILQNGRDEVATLVVETDGDLLTRFTSAVSTVPFGTLNRDTPTQEWGRPDDSREVDDGGIDAVYEWNFPTDRPNAEDQGNFAKRKAYCIQYLHTIKALFNAVKDASIMQYIAVTHTVKNLKTGKVLTQTDTSLKARAELGLDYLNQLLPKTRELNGRNWKDDYDSLEADFDSIFPTEEEQLEVLGTVEICRKLRYATAKLHNDISFNSDKWHTNTTFTDLSNKFKSTHDKLVEFQKALDDIDIADAVSKRIIEVGVTVTDTDIGSTSNLLRLKPTLVKDGKIKIEVQNLSSQAKKITIYSKIDGQYFVAKSINLPTTYPIEISTPLPKGSIIAHPYQVSQPPTDFNFIVEKEGVLYLSRKDSQEVWYTLPNSPHVMTTTSYIKVSQPIKAMKSAGAGVFIWTTNNTLYLLKGTSRDSAGNNTLSLKLIAEGAEVVNGKAVASIDNLVVWLSPYSIHNTSGIGSAEVTSTYWAPPKITNVVQSLVHHRVVYWLADTEEGRKLISFDLNRKKVLTTDAPDYQSLAEIDGELTAVTTDHKLVQIGKGDTVNSYSVGIKRYAGYSFDVRMRFTNFVIYHSASPYKAFIPDAQTKVKVFIDDWEVAEYILTGTDATRIDLPNTNNTGYSIRFELRGVLQIKSIRVRYMTHDWED